MQNLNSYEIIKVCIAYYLRFRILWFDCSIICPFICTKIVLPQFKIQRLNIDGGPKTAIIELSLNLSGMIFWLK